MFAEAKHLWVIVIYIRALHSNTGGVEIGLIEVPKSRGFPWKGELHSLRRLHFEPGIA